MKLLWKIYASKKNNIKFISDLINLVEKDSIFKHFYYFDKLSSTQDYAFKIIKRKKRFILLLSFVIFKLMVRAEKDLRGLPQKGEFGCL